ncbi:2-iminobutanoate/2-iminopropanoate deaminase [Chitinophaga dinghuensis]|uniref:2-iminobutanoate/2-iminopropanoate deaminase n=2 Tax=Chitinophaga dinghuensis TaxID=1539050 RepID=A0A327W7S9_9BACT|nr:2-iminobutanoate/2-iminopropanoate deaminase [Chitinophaga dinghuensis]
MQLSGLHWCCRYFISIFAFMEKQIINTQNAPAPIGPYNQAIKAGNTLYISGQIALNPATGELVKSGVVDETHLVMKNLQAILTEAGMSFNDVVKSTIFITDMNTFAQINEVYGSYFTGTYPARETVQVSALPKGVNVEISVIAVKG